MKRKDRQDAKKKTPGLLRAGYKMKMMVCKAEWALHKEVYNWKRAHQKTNVLLESVGKE